MIERTSEYPMAAAQLTPSDLARNVAPLFREVMKLSYVPTWVAEYTETAPGAVFAAAVGLAHCCQVEQQFVDFLTFDESLAAFTGASFARFAVDSMGSLAAEELLCATARAWAEPAAVVAGPEVLLQRSRAALAAVRQLLPRARRCHLPIARLAPAAATPPRSARRVARSGA